ncbi:MAG: efflux RND transporter permease subunit [Myxococcota bacterium]
MNLSSVSIRRPVFALMLILGLVVLGAVSLSRLEVALNPDVEFPFVAVQTVLRGASPETVESDVTDILEEEINTTEGIRTLRSVSSLGLSQIMVEFELGYDVNVKAQQVREKVALARPRLPLDVEDPVVTQFDPDASPILSVMLAGPKSIRELSEFAEHAVKERLERLPGVGSVSIVGARKREIRIWLDPLRLTGYGLATEDVAAALRRENSDLAGGRIESSSREWSVTTAGKVQDVDDFGALIVAERAGSLVHLRDVAFVEDGLEEERSIARLNGQRGVSLEVRRQSGANTVDVARAVRATLDKIRETLPPGMEISLARDYASYIERSIHSIFVDMLYGGFLAVAVVLLFLRNNRSTLIAAMAIPSSVIASFTFFYIAGFTLNTMTLMALSLSIGLVIDDAIVVVESIYRKLEAGEERVAAAEKGVSQVGLAVVSTTLAVCAVFVPIAFMEGMVGQYFYEFGLVVAVAVCFSTLIALTFTPMAASQILDKTIEPGHFFRWLGRVLVGLETAYRRLLEAALARKGLTAGLGLLAIGVGCGVATTLPFDFYTQGDQAEFQVLAKLPVGAALPVTDRISQRIERLIARQPLVRDVFATVGSGVQRSPNQLSVYVGLTPKAERSRSQAEIMEVVRKELLEAVPEAEEISVSNISWFNFNGRSAQLQYTLRGPDLDRLEHYSEMLLARMKADPDFVDVASSFETGRPEIKLRVAREVGADLGVSGVAIGRTIRALLAGEKVGSFEEAGRRYDVRLQVLPEYRNSPEQLDLIRVRSVSGDLVPLSNLVRPQMGEGAVEIQRENRTRQITLYANLSEDRPLGVGTTKLEAWGREIGISPPDELAAAGRAKAMKESGRAIAFAFVLAMVAIYMILASLFNSLIHPFTIMLSAPLSFIGGFLALKLAAMSLDLMSGIGLLVLMGLVMKNGILLVDYANQLRADGRGPDEAMLEAGPVRMRPVLMTSGALIFGLIPVAFGASSGSEFRAPMGMLTIGGLLTSTLLTLVVVPVVYCLVDRVSERLAALGRRLVPTRGARGARAVEEPLP